MRRLAWVWVVVSTMACQRSSLESRVLVPNGWQTVDAGSVRPDARGMDASSKSDGGRVDARVHDAGMVDARGVDARGVDAAAIAMCGSLPIPCAPYLCDVDAGRCKSTCDGPADCVGGLPCVSHTCVRLLGGPLCATGAECASGFCSEGVCCNSACTGSCRSCNLAGAIGTCQPVPAGAPDPHGACPGGSVCGGDGSCDSTSD
jgi:hypothetical protein